MRHDHTLTPLITAQQIFPALESLAWGAQHELFLSFRIFDPMTPLQSPELREKGLTDWQGLLSQIAARGVRIRLLIADFDAVFASDLHRSAWANARGFAAALSDDCDIVCAPHGHCAGALWMLALRGKIRRRMRALANDPADQLTMVQREFLRTRPVLRPATLHQKFAVADGSQAVIGGLDVNPRRWDTPAHDRRADETWHDVSARVEGPVCAAICAHFIDSWNTALAQGAPSLKDAGKPLQDDAPKAAPDPALRLLRTISVPRPGPSALGPRRHIDEHYQALLAAFARARRHIYIETQFFRHKGLAQALARAARHNPELNLILLMPTAPERVVFGGDDGIDARYAQALQLRNLQICQRAFGDRMVATSPAQPRAADPEDKGQLHGAGIVYVHAKVVLIDDQWGMIGSANLNGRSMHWDTEASIAFDDPATAAGLRRDLASKWLGNHCNLGDTTRAATWRKAAELNQARAPEDRTGFVMPYPQDQTRRFSLYLPILPEDMF